MFLSILYRYGSESYDGEEVTQLQHALQAAKQAEEANAHTPVSKSIHYSITAVIVLVHSTTNIGIKYESPS